LGSRPELPHHISASVDENIAAIRSCVAKSLDIGVRRFLLGNGQAAAAFFVDGLVDKDVAGRDVFSRMQQAERKEPWSIAEIESSLLSTGSVQQCDDFAEMMAAVLQGLLALFVEGDTRVLLIELISFQQRSVSEPGTDVVIRGPREGFVESLRINVSMLRRKIHHPDFVAETVRLGRYSQTDISLVYVSSIVNRDVLHELKQRLRRIDIDAILDSGQVEQLIQDTPYSLFPTIGIAEKPDIAAARMLEGRVALLVDGSPIALTAPMLFVEGLQSPEDYYTRFYYASWVRIIRFMAFAISIYMPGFFLAATVHHQQIIPFKLLLSMAAGEAKTPFSIGLSLLLIGVVFEILREAGVRLPKPAGQAVSIVGAIVMGNAAVEANLISASVLIVLAITVVASFVSATYMDASTLLRMIFLLLGWWLGLTGLLLGTLVLLIYLCSLNSFGVAFFTPLGPLDLQGLKDMALRFPLWLLKFRPARLSNNRRRMGDFREDK